MTVCLLLAAGSSSRMGKAKMLLPFRNKTLLQHIIDETKSIANAELLVVTGCYHSLLKEILEQQQVAFVQNENWEKGMGNSIQKGMQHIMQHFPEATAVLILVCDQPHISSGLIEKMIAKKKQTGKNIIACAYHGTTGIPVLFDKKYFPLLYSLDGLQGAKKIVQQFAADTATVDFPEGTFDIDTPGDYERLKETL
jgi:molybdenum cofactor cytidylyltransferase